MKTGKIAVPSMGDTADSKISKSFGRSPFFIFYDVEKKDYSVYENTGANVSDGSGHKAADVLINNKVDVLLTLEIGRKAYSVLLKEHIEIHLLASTGTVKSVVSKYLKGLEN